ncbi:MAG TPA: hypothetical protein VGM88_32465 [Kofleriaceae bacterium]|jgi:hypothetical protein
MRILSSFLALAAFAACGGSDSKSDSATGHDAAHDSAHVDSPHVDSPHIDTPTIDTPTIDAAPHATGMVVTCPANGVVYTLSIANMAYTYQDAGGHNVTNHDVNVNDIIHVVTESIHDVSPDQGNDPNLHVDFSLDTCLQFTGAGVFDFHCSIHGFTGSITVN